MRRYHELAVDDRDAAVACRVCLRVSTTATRRVNASSPAPRHRPSGLRSWRSATFRPSLSVGARHSASCGVFGTH